ncbi:hypothetical protein E2C01_048102 [Portunus trituberculatus]|uniref:Uncharacterized protein n=1 Tax=Portunus trituberculatus TaxID=210409 RepID=A0A5B7GCB8_PORTR|nr:hypothetical protein [Portunus trituberculatus]
MQDSNTFHFLLLPSSSEGFKAHETHDHCLEELERKKEALLDEDPNVNLDGLLPVCDIQEELQKVPS